MQISAVPKALKRWKKVYFYLLLMQYQMLFVSKSQVEIHFFFFFMFIWVDLQQVYFYIAEHTFKQKPFTADIGEKQTCTFPECTFRDLCSNCNIYCLIESIDNGQTWIVFEIYLDVYNVVFSIVCLTLILFNLV